MSRSSLGHGGSAVPDGVVVTRCAQDDGHGADGTAAAQLVYDAKFSERTEADTKDKNEAVNLMKRDAGSARRAMFETKMVQRKRRRKLASFWWRASLGFWRGHA